MLYVQRMTVMKGWLDRAVVILSMAQMKLLQVAPLTWRLTYRLTPTIKGLLLDPSTLSGTLGDSPLRGSNYEVTW